MPSSSEFRVRVDDLGPVDPENHFARTLAIGQPDSRLEILFQPSCGYLVGEGKLVPFTVYCRWGQTDRVRQIVPLKLLNEPDLRRMPTRLLFRYAELWFELVDSLLRDELTLLDAHRNNVMCDDAKRPVWIDLGSIRPAESCTGSALLELIHSWLYPVALCQRGGNAATAARALLADGREVTAGLAIKLAPLSTRVWLLAAVAAAIHIRIGSMALISDRVPRRLRVAAQKKEAYVTRFVWNWRNSGMPARSTIWSDYEHLEGDSSPNTRQAAVTKIGAQLEPTSIMDIGANAGGFLLPFIRKNISVVAVEPDDFALSLLAKRIESNPDLRDAQVDLVLGRFGDPHEPAEMVLCLALVHHLLIAECMPLSEVTRVLGLYTKRWLLVEYSESLSDVPVGLGRMSGISRGVRGRLVRLGGYVQRNRGRAEAPISLTQFLDSLRDHFSTVKVVHVEAGGGPSSKRHLILAEK